MFLPGTIILKSEVVLTKVLLAIERRQPSTATARMFVPVVSIKGNKVDVVVGSVIHPMTPEHFIQFIVLETEKGFQVKELTPSDEPKASFTLAEGEKIVAVYEYCNLHNLWKA